MAKSFGFWLNLWRGQKEQKRDRGPDREGGWKENCVYFF